VLVSVSAITSETDERASWLAGPAKKKFLARRLGERILLPSPRDAASFAYAQEHRLAIDEQFASVIIGGPETVMKGLRSVAEMTGADELMITTQVFDHADRRRSYELIAGLAR
jgi:alkanesulfonate monooxygenase SsuD/methylene tetrahydromethanopterin reductase-like flavin-dependent oxidoreductase (luciferase family)